MMRAGSGEAPARDGGLIRTMQRMLDEGMGVRRSWGPGMFGLGPLACASIWLVGYALAWAIAEGIAGALHIESRPQLVTLLAWGGLYAAAVTILAQNAALMVFDTVRRDIVPHASERYCAAVAADIDRRFPRHLLTPVSLALGLVSLVVAFLAIDRDIGIRGETPLYAPELLLWAASYLYYFVCAARAVIAARFYLSFAALLETERDAFYVLGAARTPLVRGLSRLGIIVLGFWALVFVTVLSMMLLAAPSLGAYGFPARSMFIFLVVPLAGIFSMGMGSAAYLAGELRIRTVLRRFTNDQAALVQAEAKALFDPAAGHMAPDPDRLQRLADWHDRIIAGGQYGSGIRAALSIAVPLAGLIQTVNGWLNR